MVPREERRDIERGGRGEERKEREEMCARGRMEKRWEEWNGKGRKDNAPTIKLSRLTPRIKRPQRTLGSVTKLLEYFAPLK